MSQITIEHNPSEERLKELGVVGWPSLSGKKKFPNSRLILMKQKPPMRWKAKLL